jgi:hypothetical protein
MGAGGALLDPADVQGGGGKLNLIPAAGPPTRKPSGRAGRPQGPSRHPGAPSGCPWPLSAVARPRPRSGTRAYAGRRWDAAWG